MNRSEWLLSVPAAEGGLRALALNIISRQGAAALATEDVGSELVQMLRDDSLTLPALPQEAVAVAALSGPAVARGAALADIIAGNDRLRSRLMLVGCHAAADPDLRLDTPQEVIDWIGPAEAGDIVYTASLQDALFHGHGIPTLALRQWQVGVGAAIWSREGGTLARRRSRWTYACGLLHDIGKPVTALACAELAGRLGVALDDAATAQLVREHHAAATALVARRWQLPPAVTQCLRDGREAGGGGQDPGELPVVLLGRQLAELVAGQGPEFAREALGSDPLLDLLNIGPDRFRGLLDRAGWVARQVEAY